MTKNTLIGNGANGVSATFVVPSITVVKNVAIGNFFAGFSAVGPGTFTKNVANANLVEGIAASAATDGGGNKARDNAFPEQCSPAIACQ